MGAASYPSNWTIKPVQTISGDDIGRMMRFYAWDAAREISTVVTAELRQVSHQQGRTSLTYGMGAEREESFEEGEVVILNPSPDYSDVVDLREHFQTHYAIEGTH